MDIQEGMGGIDWIDLAEDRDMWRALVDAVMRACKRLMKDSTPWRALVG
jgi:hypothetical protein